MTTALIINIVGLILDIAGVTGIYFTRIKGLGRIDNPFTIRLSSTMQWNEADEIKTRIDDLGKDILSRMNSMIEKTNQANERAHNKSLIWFALIAVGFLFQLVSYIIQLKVSC